MRHTSESSAPVAAAVLGTSVSSSNQSMVWSKVRLSDSDLFARVQRVEVPERFVDLRRLSSKRGWKHVRMGNMDMQFRECQVVVGGEIKANLSDLLSLLRCPTESESNSAFRDLYGSQFIYSSLVHAVPCMERESQPASATPGQQLTVRTVCFVHKRRLQSFLSRRSVGPTLSESGTSNHSQHHAEHKNEQCCFIELLTPTQKGIQLAFCTLDAAEVLAGKAPTECVVALHPISGWLLAGPNPDNPEKLQITYQAAFSGNLPGNCDLNTARTRLLSIGKRICRLEKILRRRRRLYRQQHIAPGRLWQAILNPFRNIGLAGSDQRNSKGTHHNWHCIACTQSFLPTIRKNWSRCDLCAYRICTKPPCCTQERVAIYNRYVAPLLVCARCRECIGERESLNRGDGNPVVSTGEDCRYIGISLQFKGPESELEPELELDPSGRSVDRWGSIHTSRRSSTAMRRMRRAYSDPPPLLGLALSSSGEENRSSAAEIVMDVITKN
ncbi:hypothetical protein Plhal710r2_c038g0135201 [Plasmopara halstedii]